MSNVVPFRGFRNPGPERTQIERWANAVSGFLKIATIGETVRSISHDDGSSVTISFLTDDGKEVRAHFSYGDSEGAA